MNYRIISLCHTNSKHYVFILTVNNFKYQFDENIGALAYNMETTLKNTTLWSYKEILQEDDIHH